ncbi:hypothetical protein [Bailinhaonella thermotolerans]|nr:hypothetical protein [Bailinhaonella thermotolerans]
MRRAIGYAAAWLGAAVLASGVSWLGVREVLHGAVFDDPGVVTVVPRGERPPLAVSETTLASPAPRSPAPSRTAAPRAPRPAPTPTRSPRPRATPPAQTDVRSYTVRGGRVALALGPRSARLVSATPNPGYQVKTWRNKGWFRVDLVNGPRGSAVIAMWHDSPTRVEVYEY